MPVLAPDRDSMFGHLSALFDDIPTDLRDGLIEMSWTDGVTGRLSRAKLFPAVALGEAADAAARLNAVCGQNVYVGAALRRPKTIRWRRATDANFYALTAVYVDFDGPGDVERAEALCREKGIDPSFKIYTGRHPHARAQFWFRLREPQRDPDACRRLNRAMADALGGDVAVVNPGRVMRLGGSVAWPKKEGRIVERTEFVLAEGEA